MHAVASLATIALLAIPAQASFVDDVAHRFRRSGLAAHGHAKRDHSGFKKIVKRVGAELLELAAVAPSSTEATAKIATATAALANNVAQASSTVSSATSSATSVSYDSSAIYWAEAPGAMECGTDITDNSTVVGLPRETFSTELCGQEATLTNTATGQVVTLTVAAASSRDDWTTMTEASFLALGGDADVGELAITISFKTKSAAKVAVQVASSYSVSLASSSAAAASSSVASSSAPASSSDAAGVNAVEKIVSTTTAAPSTTTTTTTTQATTTSTVNKAALASSSAAAASSSAAAAASSSKAAAAQEVASISSAAQAKSSAAAAAAASSSKAAAADWASSSSAAAASSSSAAAAASSSAAAAKKAASSLLELKLAASATSSSKAAAAAQTKASSSDSSSSSSSSGMESGGEITYYYQTGEVNCEAYNGGKVSDSDMICAVSEFNYYTNALCGEKIKICYESNCVEVTIVDSCEACDATHFDLSPAAFTALAGGLDAGQISSGVTFELP